MNSVLFHIILLTYLFATLLCWLQLGMRQRRLLQAANGLLSIGCGLHTAVLGYRLLAQPWRVEGDIADAMSLLAWAIIGGYWLAWWRYRMEALGAFLVPLAFLAMAASGVLVTTRHPMPSALQHVLLVVHIFLAVLGYAALALTFCAGVMYLIQERQLKSRQPGVLLQRLPSLRALDELNARALVLGLPLLTQGLITGSIWAKYTRGAYLSWNLTSLPLLLAWGLYALLVGGRYTCGWQGKKAALAAVIGFLLVLASFFVHTL
jgi:ABC-type transport system involved in cytochrome c biogenesis permease subunit